MRIGLWSLVCVSVILVPTRVRAAADLDCAHPPGEAHLFKVGEKVMCVPQKNGNRNWGGFVLYLTRGKVPRNATQVVSQMATFSTDFGPVLSNLKRKPKQKSFFIIARNPFSRVLSQYLNHVAVGGCIATKDTNAKLGCNQHTSNHAATPDHFRKWVKDMMTKAWLHDGLGLCAREHHLCQQAKMCALQCFNAAQVRVLKLERQADWYDGFLDQLGLDHAQREGLHGEAWVPFSSQPAFYTKPTADNPVTVDAVHATNATGRLLDFYDAATAEIVAKTYADDFAAFGYCKTWACLNRYDLS